jgi:hypothetical protein
MIISVELVLGGSVGRVLARGARFASGFVLGGSVGLGSSCILRRIVGLGRRRLG